MLFLWSQDLFLAVPPRDAVGNADVIPASTPQWTHARSCIRIMMQPLYGLLHAIIRNPLFRELSDRTSFSGIMIYEDDIETKFGITPQAILAAVEGVK